MKISDNFYPITKLKRINRYQMSDPINPNNAINTDSKERRSFVPSIIAAGYGER